MFAAIVILLVAGVVALLVVAMVRSESRRLRRVRGTAPLPAADSAESPADNSGTEHTGTWSAGQWVAISMLAPKPGEHHHEPDKRPSPELAPEDDAGGPLDEGLF